MGEFKLEFYTDEHGRQPAREWLRSLPAPERRAAGVALHFVLAREGIDVCRGQYGKQLGNGLFELRVQESASQIIKDKGLAQREEAASGRTMLRLFCHARGDRVIVLLGGYDKSRDTGARRQQREINTARSRLTSLRGGRPQLGQER